MKIYIKDYYTKEVLVTVDSDYVPRTNDVITIDDKKYKVCNDIYISYFTNGDNPFVTIVARNIN